MKIQNITNLYNPFVKNTLAGTLKTNGTDNPFCLERQPSCDVVSFRAKAYNADSVSNPTGHCAYCGCKVYTEQQTDSLAKEILRDSSHRLQGDIKSILEKLDTAERSYELTIAKQLENKDEIEFFKKLLQQSEDKSWLKGDAIFKQVYGLDTDEAFEILKRNMKPLIKTVDHVSPQNLGEDNKDDDINLVEACYCCNHDLKKGMTFEEFYTMYPSIKENMPVEKFKYAHAKLLSSSSDSILKKVSASNLIKYLSNLFEQRKKALAQVDSVDYRIAETSSSVAYSIESCQNEIDEKKVEIAQLSSKLSEIENDEEYRAMIKRLQLIKQKNDIDSGLDELREKRKNLSVALNDLTNTDSKSKKVKTKSKLSAEQIEQKKAYYRQQLIDLKLQIDTKEKEKDSKSEEIQLLDELYPSIDKLQHQKSSYDTVINAYSQSAAEDLKLAGLKETESLLSSEIQELDAQILSFPREDFVVGKYSADEQAIYSQYISLLEAMKYVQQHSSGTGVKAVVNKSAQVEIQRGLDKLSSEPVVVAANDFLKKKELISKRDKKNEDLATVQKDIVSCKNRAAQLQKITNKCTLEEAKVQSAEISAKIRVLTDKQNYLKIPSTIEKLEAEIIMLSSLIESLKLKQNEITELTAGK